MPLLYPALTVNKDSTHKLLSCSCKAALVNYQYPQYPMVDHAMNRKIQLLWFDVLIYFLYCYTITKANCSFNSESFLIGCLRNQKRGNKWNLNGITRRLRRIWKNMEFQEAASVFGDPLADDYCVSYWTKWFNTNNQRTPYAKTWEKYLWRRLKIMTKLEQNTKEKI